MKKFKIAFLRLVVPLALLLPLTVPVACNSDHGASAPADTALRPIVFCISSDDVAEETTRGVLINSMSGTFGLMASQYEGEWDLGHPMNYMYNEAVWGSGTDWQTSHGYFAPSSLYKLKFFAYYPYYENVNTGVYPITFSDADVETDPSLVYTMPQDAEEQQDLMYAISGEVHANVMGRFDTIRLHFHHLLTAVSIAAGESFEEVKITKVTLTDLFYLADFDYNTTTLVTTISKKRDCWANLNLKAKKIGEGYRRADPDKSFLLLPQRNRNGVAVLNSNASLKVECETGGKTYTFTKNLSELKEALGTPGRNIVLHLKVESVQRMSIYATITNWVSGANFNGAVSDQPSINLGSVISDWETVDSQGDSTTTDITTGPKD